MPYTQNRLRQLREDRELKQTTVAAEVGISRAMLSNYESGKMPSLWSGIKLAQYYHVSLDYILGLSAEKSATEGSLTSSFATLSQMAPSSAPTASDVAMLLDAALLYQCSGAPCGEQPLVACRDFLRHLADCFSAAAKRDSVKLADSANAATIAALDIAKMPAKYYESSTKDRG